MKIIQIAFFLTILTSTLTRGQNIFMNTYGYDSTNYVASDIVETMDGGFVMTGNNFQYTPGTILFETFFISALIVKTDSYGDTIWTRQFSELTYGSFFRVFEMPDSNIVLIGSKNASVMCGGVGNLWPYQDYVYLKLDKDGNFIDFIQYVVDCDENFQDAMMTQDGGFAILGVYQESGPWGTIMNTSIDKFDNNGIHQWTKYYPNPYYEVHSLIQDINENYYYTGLKYDGIDFDALLVKTDLNGDTLFNISISDTSQQLGMHLTEADASGNFLITARDAPTSDWNNAPFTKFYKVDGMGNLIWSKTYEFLGYESKLTSDGGFMVLGTEKKLTPFDSLDMYVVRLDSNGDSLWARSYGGIKYDYPASMCLTSDGGYAALGTLDAFNYLPTPSRYFLAKDTLLFTGLFDPLTPRFETKIYPNPFQHHSNVELLSNKSLHAPELKIYDCSGRDLSNKFHVSENSFGNHHSTFEITNLNKSQGLFIFKIFDQGELISVGKFLTSN